VRRLSLGATTAVLLAACLGTPACYEPTAFRVSARTPMPARSCGQIADDVFFDAAYQRVASIYGPDRFYTPRLSTGTVRVPALQWGIGVWIKGETGSACEYELESLQTGSLCTATQCVYAPQRGAEFDEGVKDFARRLSVATR